MTCLRHLDGRHFNVNSRRPQYREVDGSISQMTYYTPLQSDITTAVSLAATATRVAGGWWATGYIWRCIFVAMERGGISAKGLSQAISSWPPAPRHFTRKSSMLIIYLTLFATFVIDYFSAVLTGSFIWEAADSRTPGRIPLTISNGTLNYNNAFGGDDAFEWVQDPQQVLTDTQIPLLNQTRDVDPEPRVGGGGVQLKAEKKIVDAVNFKFSHAGLLITIFTLIMTYLQPVTPLSTPRILATRLAVVDPSRVPYSRCFNSMLYASLRCLGLVYGQPPNYTINPGFQINLFGGVNGSMADILPCFAIANVSYRAGASRSRNCKTISPNVVGAEDAPFSLIGNPLTSDALGLSPILGTNLMLSTYAIPSNYGTRRNFFIKLTSRAYQAAWAALSDFETSNLYVDPTTTTAGALVTVNERAREPSAATCRRLANAIMLGSVDVGSLPAGRVALKTG
ncbi:uncharacterized protein LACBIDRAFT_333518 [Laccaria bicolor S238N-H82]|uniref:Predicted protein n=1 Tax=Laccaria bicolor (strain S238N-H82 / ATCC MYA-4686) TaxID=486041 RepID=B0DW61_LACBS|nr:uncharacterized protein LACBIDRAFT_333518 [Laccaria bicolor S238N-H82]EDR01175.1 predicted protein [Laccaria bicolor S238N-H82]|eukprot:XP_001888217.1 predicted protein [Laccaria bicolor S238N-H82]